MPRSWDIFCAVVDNYGDIGVCWRLARQLAREQHAAVRLWVDDLARFTLLCPQIDAALAVQTVQGVEVRHWTPVLSEVVPAEVVVEGFGCRLPEAFVAAMLRRAPQPVWINLEYLSAEDWVETHHGLASPQPQLPLVKYFFFPGFTPRTGGLALEQGLAGRRDAFQRNAAARAAFRASIGLAAAAPDTLTVSLFCYAEAPLPRLLEAWCDSGTRIECLVPPGAALQQIEAHIGVRLPPGGTWSRGALRLHAIPFLDQDGYDRVLWASALNFVRGEDSFVRAQFASSALVWQAYPQDGGTHLIKMEAFLERYCAGMEGAVAAPLRQFWRAWNQPGRGAADWRVLWRDVAAAIPAWRAEAEAWSTRLGASSTLADNLALFCQSKLK